MEDVVVFAALAWEARAALDALQGVEALGARRWRGFLGDGAAVRVLQIGVGLDRAERRVADAAQARFYLSCGCAGGLVPGLRAGDLVIGDRILALDAAGRVSSDVAVQSEAIASWSDARDIAVHVGRIASSPVLLPSVERKRQAAEHGALVVEMESAAVATAARAHAVPCAVIKVVLDEAADAVGFPGGEVVDPETGELDVARGVASLAVRPWWWPRAARLARQQRVAERRLRQYLALLFSAGLDAFGCGPQPRGALAG